MTGENLHNLPELPVKCGFEGDVSPADARCPVTPYRPNFVPSRLIEEAKSGWFPLGIRHCIGCELCSPNLLSSFPKCADRIILAGGPREGHFPRAFGGALDAIVDLQIKGNRQNRLDWITHELKINTGSPSHGIGLFVGCSPYYDPLLSEILSIRFTNEAHAAVTLLNAIGIDPVVLEDEVCCGGDRLHAADRDGFVSLGSRNLELFKKRGVKTIITVCDDCRYTLSNRYTGRIPGWDFYVVRLADFLFENNGKLAFSSVKKTVAIQPGTLFEDPSGKNSISGLLRRVPDLKIVEIEPGHPSTFGGWNQFDGISKRMESAFLKSAEMTHADVLLIPSSRVLAKLSEGRRPGSWELSSIEIKGLYGFLSENHIVLSEFAGA